MMAYGFGSEKLFALSGQLRHQARLIHVMLILMTVYFAVIGTLNVFVFASFDIAALDYAGMLGTLGLLLYFRRTANLKVTSWSVVLILTLILLMFIYLANALAYSMIWVTVLPPIAFFLLGRKSGAWLCALVFAFVLIFFYAKMQSAPATSPSLGSLLNIAEVLLAHLFIFLFYERSRAEAYEELERLSETDKLTGLFNRRHLDKLLTQEFSRYQRSQSPLSLVLCDIDHFKRVNDNYGHLTGDKVMQEIASIFMSTIRATDMCGRWGGEEFLLIFPDTSRDGAVSIVKDLQGVLANTTFAQGINITLSFGISSTAHDRDAEQQLRRADDALYEAKRQGRNCYVVAPDSLS